MQKPNGLSWVYALTNVGLGVVESIANKQMSSPSRVKSKKGCTPCDAKAYASNLFQKKR